MPMNTPDPVKIFLDYLRTSTALQALGALVQTERPANMPRYVVIVDIAGGSTDDSLGQFIPRLQLFSYGPGSDIPTRQRTAMELSRKVHDHLFSPNQGGPIVTATAVVKTILTEAWPLRVVEPQTEWVYVLGVYRPRIIGLVPA
jgi:hypothetical protein